MFPLSSLSTITALKHITTTIIQYLYRFIVSTLEKILQLNQHCKISEETNMIFPTENNKFWYEVIAYYPLTRHGSNIKLRFQQFFVAAATSLSSYYLATIGGYVLPTLCLATTGGIHIETHRLMRRIYWSTPFRWAQVPCYTYAIS
jgi:hypothetical protein